MVIFDLPLAYYTLCLVRYCQAILKSLKYGRAPELDTWRQLVSSLEERIRAHQQVFLQHSVPLSSLSVYTFSYSNILYRVVTIQIWPQPNWWENCLHYLIILLIVWSEACLHLYLQHHKAMLINQEAQVYPTINQQWVCLQHQWSQ